MENALPERHARRTSRGRWAVAVSFLLALMVSGTAAAQQRAVSGTVLSSAGSALPGVTVRVQGTEIRAVTSENGRFVISAPADATLSFTRVGLHALTMPVGGRATLAVTMTPIVAKLEEVLVTGYTSQRGADITGAVASVNVDAANRQTGASVLQRIDAVTPGVTVTNSGSPGSRSTVRIRGISSFQNNEPLYVVDGTPMQDSYVNFINPNDITSIQVLKDASAASIYGSRASNGVIVIETTKRGVSGPPKATFRVRTGVQSPVRGYDDFVIQNSLDYFQVVKASYLNAGLPVPTNIFGDPNNPTIPAYTFVTPSAITATDAWGRPTGVDVSKYSFPNNLIMPASTGTDWWKAMFGSAPVADYNLDVSGGGQDNAYGVSFNYFDQSGTSKYTDFKRGSVRANTSFTRGKLNFGENIAVAIDRHFGGAPDDPGAYAEDGILGKNILMQPVVPIYDIQGNFASGKATGLGNQSNPLKEAFFQKDNVNKNDRVFGNVFGGFDITPALSLKTRLGFNVGEGAFQGFNAPVPENSEPSFNNSIIENNTQFQDWTLTNTARYLKSHGEHSFDLLLGQEANGSTSHFLQGQLGSLINTGVDSRFIQDALGDASTKNVLSTGTQSALLSFFGKAGYNYSDKYVASFTLRKDGSSRLAPGHQWGTFPAVGLGWRITKERFLANNKMLSDVMLRYGWGVTGNQLIPSGRILSQFGGSNGDTYYDISGSDHSVAAGYRQTSLGNPDLKWEEQRSQNVGADVTLYDGLLNFVVDVYSRNTNNLLYNPSLPGSAGIAAAPIVNIGKMKNTGIDLSIGHTAENWNATLQASHYTNTIVSIDGQSNAFFGALSNRFGNQVVNQVGSPIGSFYGLIADGYFRDSADVAAHAAQDGAAPGRIKFRDVNGDGKITAADQTVIGSPHPNWTAGLDLGYRRGNWDLSGTVFGTFGNKIFDTQKEFLVFREFNSNVYSDLLQNSWTPTNLNAKYPRLDQSDTYSHQISSYYIEDGSYVRMRNLQLGYNVPPSMINWLPSSKIYVQAENLFTITGYPGLDPALPNANVTGSAGDTRDQYRGIDRGAYPSSRTFSVGIATTF
jgi:TonB-linked SusC/RagA family outer membrane protein